MDLETALICLKGQQIRFVQPSEWSDKYERHFYNADYSDLTKDANVCPRVWACCFTTNKMSEASWNTYRYGKQGLGAKCVKFQISRSKLRSFIRSDSRVEYTYEGFMDYSVSDFDIQHLHMKSSHLYNTIFSHPFTRDKYLSLLLIKRSAFNYEEEFRFLITIVDGKTDDKQLLIPIKWAELIEAVEVDIDMSEMEIHVLKTYLRTAGVSEDVISKVNRTNLYNDPKGNVKIEV
jgi:hypothetical protein